MRAGHREIEEWLDRLLKCVSASSPDLDEPLSRATELLLRHYETEERTVFASWRCEMPEMIGKMMRQHDDVRELSEAASGLAQAPHSMPSRLPELLYHCRRLHALAQHNIIEEERDLFPLLRRREPGA
jgi:hemerythrin superfamily protein